MTVTGAAFVRFRLTPQRERSPVDLARERHQSKVTLAVGVAANGVDIGFQPASPARRSHSVE